MEKDVYELTNPQKSIWYIEQFYKDTNINTICGTAIINEKVDFKLLKSAICHVVKNNKSFGTRIILENNAPKQYFSSIENYKVDIINVNSIDEMENYKKDLIKTPFVLTESYLFKFLIFKFPNNHGAFVLNIHHLISDAWTLGFVCNEVIKNYSNLKDNKSLISYTSSYLDYMNSEKEYINSSKYEKDKEFWNSMDLDSSEIAILPGTSNSKLNLTSCIANRKTYRINKDLVDSIKAFCKKEKVSAFNFFMAIFGLYIGRACNLKNFVIGTPILNRCNFNDKNSCGMYISTMPFKIGLNYNLSFNEFVKSISRQSLNMLRHQKYPYQTLLEDLRKENKNIQNLYNILFSYQITNTKNNDTNIDYNTEWSFNGNCADPINIHIHDLNDTGNLEILYDYQTSIYTLYDISSIHNRILSIISQVLSIENILLKNIEIITNKEKEIILSYFNNTSFPYDESVSVINLFEKQVKKYSNKTALVCNDQSFSYDKLNRKANLLAHHLKNKCNVHPNDVIGIMINRTPEMIVGLLAILKCGATYLPIDPEYPSERISYMLENSNVNTVLISSITDEAIPVKYTKVNIELSTSIYKENEEKESNLDIYIDPRSIAYLIYTSGSTGKPKGVTISNKSLTNFVEGMKHIINFSPKKVMVSLTTICFDIFGLELWCSLTSGQTLVIANEREQNVPEELNKLCLKNKVNMIQTTPSRYTNLLGDKEHIEFLKNITDIMVGGEALTKSLLAYLKENSSANIYNMYGPTETTIWSTVKDMTNTDIITVGKPIINTQCYILDKNKKLLPPYTPGELYIGGDGVSSGYLNRQALTEEKFVKSPFSEDSIIYNTNDLAYYNNDGEIIHLGRTDLQVKIRGYRIELGEIENRIISFGSITNAVVIPDNDNKYLSCYFVAKEPEKTSKLISYLLKYLPNYMIPAYFKQLDEIPLTPNGKIDRKALPKIDKNDSLELAKTKTEKIISSILSGILETENIDINTPFLSLGLDSLGLIQVQTALLSYNLNITTQSFYRYPSIKKLAKRIDSHTEYYTELNFKVPSQFKHYENELEDKIYLSKNDVLGNVLLTGANGFIGIHILHELLKTTDCKIYCFVRGENISHSIERLKESYEFYFKESIEIYINNRILVYNGQIIYDNFQLFDEQISDITKNINTIIHTAAIVKHYGDFEQFKEANIDGTRRIVEFAYNNNKRLIHISSISVSGNYLVKQDNQNTDFTENDLYIGQHYTNNVYVNSKFDAEKIVYSYMEKGLTAEVMRVGILSGRYSDGFFQKNIKENAFYSRIKSLIDLKTISKSILDQKIEFTPVDLCAKAIVLLSKTKLTENKVYHLYNHNLIQIEEIAKVLKDFDIDISSISEKDFEKYILKLSSDNKNNQALKGIINDFSFKDSNLSLNYGYTVNVLSDYTQKYLKTFGFEWPLVSDLYLRKIIKYMRDVKFI